MQHFTAAEWVLIDAATQWGMDKEFYDVRLNWAKDNLINPAKRPNVYDADTPALFTKALIAIDDIIAGNPTGHIIGLDARASGPQILSVLLHCETGMINTGAINSNSVPDLYTTIFNNMASSLKNVSRSMVKKATVPYVYGSDAAPKNVFQNEVELFETAYARALPEAHWVRKVLINAWDPTATEYNVTAPDSFTAHMETRVTRDFKGELMGYNYTYQTKVNAPIPTGDLGSKSLVANVTHIYDGFIVRELKARCNYNHAQLKYATDTIDTHKAIGSQYANDRLLICQGLWMRHNFLSVSALDMIEGNDLDGLSENYLDALLAAANKLMAYPSFGMVHIHDEFKSSPIHTEALRTKYNEIMAESYASTWLLDIIYDLTGQEYVWDTPFSMEVYNQILDSDYAIG